MNEREQLLTVGEAARLAGVSTRTVKRWLHSGALHGVRTSPGMFGHWRIRETDVRDLLERNTTGGGQDDTRNDTRNG